MASSVCFLTYPRITCLGPHHQLWAEPFYTSHPSRKCPTCLPRGHSHGGFFSTEVPLDDSRMCRAENKLTGKHSTYHSDTPSAPLYLTVVTQRLEFSFTFKCLLSAFIHIPHYNTILGCRAELKWVCLVSKNHSSNQLVVSL